MLNKVTVTKPENPDDPYDPELPPAEDEEEVPADQKPAMTVNKTSAQATFTAAGDVLNYTVTVTNTGNVTMTNLVITDTLVPFAQMTLTESVTADGHLQVGETWTLTYTYTVTAFDVTQGFVINSVTAASPEYPDDPAGDSNTVLLLTLAPVPVNIPAFDLGAAISNIADLLE